MKFKDVGEFGFIDRIAARGLIRKNGVVKAIGDDCAVIDTGSPEYLLITADLLVERIHFMTEWASPEIFGAKALTVNVSDVAACGGIPLDAFVSIAVPKHFGLDWVTRFYDGLYQDAAKYQVNILGGDTTGSRSDFVVNITLTGSVEPDRVLLRHKAKLGDLIFLTGPVGESAAGLHILRNPGIFAGEYADACVEAHLKPRAHVAQGRLCGSLNVKCAIDISDGLSSDLGHICRQSGIGAVVNEADLPLTDLLMNIAELTGVDPLDWVLNGGEDYVLLGTAEPHVIEKLKASFKDNGLTLYVIGYTQEEPGLFMRRRDGSVEKLTAGGWDHFR